MRSPADNRRQLNLLRVRESMLTKGAQLQAEKQFCARGHEYNEVNTYIDSRGARKCRVCNKENAKRYRDERRRAVEEVRACSTAAK